METPTTPGSCRRGRALLPGDVGPILLLGALTLALFSPYLLHPSWLIYPASGLGSDLVDYFWPNINAFATALGDGSLLLWNSTSALGYPTVGNIGLLWLYPPALILLIVPPPYAFTLLAVIHVYLGAILFYFLIRSFFPISRPASLVGAIAFIFMPKVAAHLAGGHITTIYGLAWLPAVLLGARKAMQSRRLWPAACAGLALALQLSTHPQIPLSTLYLLAGMLAWSCWQVLRRCGWRSKELRNAIWWAVVVSVTTGLVAVSVGAIWWIPIAELLPWSVPISFDGSIPFWYQLPLPMLLTLLAPTDLQFPEWVIYVGVVPLFLALIAMMGTHRRSAVFLWIAVAAALMMALGDRTPFYSLARWVVPGLGYFRTRTRLWFLGGIAIALLSGLGADAIGHEETWRAVRSRLRLFKLTSAAYVFAGTIAALGMGLLTHRLPVEMLRAVSAGTLFWILFWYWQTHSTTREIHQIAVLALVVIDLLPLASGFMTELDLRDRLNRLDPVTEFVAQQPGIHRVYSPQRSLPYLASAELGIETMDGLINLQLAHVVSITNVASGCRQTGFTSGMPPCLLGDSDSQEILTAKPEPSVLGLLNVRYIIAGSGLSIPDLAPVFTNGSNTVYENRRLLPRSFVLEQVEIVASEDDLFRRLTTIDPAQTGLVESSQDIPALPGGPAGGDAAIDSEEPGRIRISVQAGRASLMVYSEAWAPGWRARVNGADAEVIRVDGALLGVIIPAGASEVAFDYHPFGWKLAWPISLTSLLALMAWWITSLVRSRRRANPTSECSDNVEADGPTAGLHAR